MLKFALKWFKNLFPPLLGFFLIYYSFTNTSVEDRNTIYLTITNVSYPYVILSVFFGMLSHISRSMRWQQMLSLLGYKVRISNLIMFVLIAFLSNLGIPRSGEILRASSATFYNNIPFEKSFRACDVLFFFAPRAFLRFLIFVPCKSVPCLMFTSDKKSCFFNIEFCTTWKSFIIWQNQNILSTWFHLIHRYAQILEKVSFEYFQCIKNLEFLL